MNESEIVMKTLIERRSSRKYQDKLVPDEVIKKIVDAGLYAASGANRQPAVIIAITNPEIVNKLAEINTKIADRPGSTFYGAKQVIVVVADKSAPTYVYDGALAMGNMMNAAEALGVSSCWIHRAKETFELPEWKEFLKELGLEGEYEGIGNLIIGYDDNGKNTNAPRKPNREFWVK